MKRMLILAVAALSTVACADWKNFSHRDENPYEKSPFYAKYLNTGSALDAEMTRLLAALQANPNSAELHNDLGALLVEKGFPRDAEREFERSVNADSKYYPAWYNLGLVRAANHDDLGARHAYRRAVHIKPGHAAALFQLGLIEEKRKHTDRAVELYAKAFRINPRLLEVDVNPRVLDSSLIDLALLRMYKNEHSKKSMQFQDAPSFVGVTAAANTATTPPRSAATPSPQPAAQDIVTPGAPATDPGTQQPAPRRRRPRPDPAQQQQPPAQNPPS